MKLKILYDTLIVCNNLTILNLSHNVHLRDDGAVAVCEAATKLPHLRALLLERCSIDDRCAKEIARFFAQGRLPFSDRIKLIMNIKSQQQKSENQQQAVLLTLDLGWNRIGYSRFPCVE